MEQSMVERIKANPKFTELVTKRTKFGWQLSIVMLVIYYAFILVIAFAPEIFGARIGTYTTLGIPVGLLIILSAFALTGVYVKRANSEFDELTKAIKQDAKGHA